ncbi:unnamed protein product, partial [Didymodactylos carnosus]
NSVHKQETIGDVKLTTTASLYDILKQQIELQARTIDSLQQQLIEFKLLSQHRTPNNSKQPTLFHITQQPQPQLTHQLSSSHRPNIRLHDTTIIPSPVSSTIHLKASDLPTYRGRQDEDQWVEQVSAIKQYSHTTDGELLKILPLVFRDNALTWFTTLGETKRSTLTTWGGWKEMLKQAFRPANYQIKSLRDLKYRTLTNNESVNDYYFDKCRLLRVVFGENVEEATMVNDIIDGLSGNFKMFVLSRINPNTSLEELRRILVDLDSNIHEQKLNNTYRSSVKFHNHSNDHNERRYLNSDTNTNRNATPTTRTSKINPPSPCPLCQGRHWKNDCPLLQQQQQRGLFNNRSVLTRNVYDSKINDTSNNQHRRINNTIALNNNRQCFSIDSNNTHRIDEQHPCDSIEPSNLSYDHIHTDINNVYHENNISSSSPIDDNKSNSTIALNLDNSLTEQNLLSDNQQITYMPEIMITTIDSDETTTYQNLSPAQSKIMINNHILIACIDTGSSISIIDSQILNEIGPDAKIEPPPSIVLQTVNSTSHPMGKTRLNDAFVNKTNSTISSIPIEFIIISNAHTKIIIGYDCLLKNGAKLNLVDGHFTLKDSKSGQIPFIVHDDKQHFLEQQKPLSNVETTTPSTPETGSSRVHGKKSSIITSCNFIIRPFHRALVPVLAISPIETKHALIESTLIRDGEVLTRVANTVVKSNHKIHHVELINLENRQLLLKRSEQIATISPLLDSSPIFLSKTFTSTAVNTTNHVRSNDNDDDELDKQIFLDALRSTDINLQLSMEQKLLVIDMLLKHRKAFAYGDRKIGCTNIHKMRIETGDAAPVSKPPYHASPRERRIMENQIIELEQQDIIEDSSSEWASPVVLVMKKDGTIRMCVDYRRLNSVTKTDQYPVPRMEDILTHFSQKQYFSTFDCNKGFHQIELATDDDKQKTAFRSHLGLKQYKRMPFGLKNGSAIFQRVMDKILKQYNWKLALVYVDDLIVSSVTFEEHLDYCDKILKLLIDANNGWRINKRTPVF